MINCYVVQLHYMEKLTFRIKSAAFTNYKAAKEYYDDLRRMYSKAVEDRPESYNSCWDSDHHHFTVAYKSSAQLDIFIQILYAYEDSGLPY